MEPTRLLYLRLRLAQKDAYLDVQLQKGGFKLTKKTGIGLESFRNYFYEMTGAPGALEVSFKIMPGKHTTQIVSLSLAPDIHPKHVERLFTQLSDLSTRIPLDLLDLNVRNKIYKRLHEEGKVNEFYVGLDQGEQLVVEQQAYIPLDAALFLGKEKEEVVQESPRLEGERAPDWDV